MPPDVRIRRATDEDLPRVAPLWRKLAELEASLAPRFAVKPDAERQWLDELAEDRANARADVFVAEAGNRFVAFLHVRATRGAPFHAEDRLGFVDAVWVEPEHRKGGIATRLLAEAETWCRQRRLPILEAGVVVANKDALAAWERLGFRMTAATVTRPLAKDARGAVAKAFDAQADRIEKSPYFTFEKRVRRLVDFAKPEATQRVLDVGCGAGVLLAAFAMRARRVVGVEISREMAARARASGGEVVLAAAEHLPFRDGAFDRVVTRATVHHLPDPHTGFRDMARTVAPGGALVVEDLVASDDPERAKRHNELEALRDASHQRMLSQREMRDLAQRQGLNVEETLVVREPRELEAWLAISAPPAADADRVRALARAYASRADKDETGLLLRLVGDEVRFDHTHLLLRAAKSGGSR